MTLVKRLTATLLAGQTNIQLSDTNINNDSIIEVYTDSDSVYPVNITQTGNNINILFERQDVDINIAVMIINITQLDSYTTPNLSDLPDVDISDPTDGQIITCDDGIWKNTDFPEIETIYDKYDKNEDPVIGKWFDGRPIKRHWHQWNSNWSSSGKKTSPLSLTDLGADIVLRVVYLDLVRKVAFRAYSVGMNNNDGTGTFNIWINDYFSSTGTNTALIYDYVVAEEV